MNIVKTPVDIKTLIQTSTIDIYNKTKLVEKLQQHFSEEEQRHYVCNLFLYLNYHPTDDFIVNLENVWKFIGFSNKANAKRLLKHNFKENSDYKLIFIRTDENKTLLIPTDEQVPNTKDGKNIGGRTFIRTDDGKFSNETRGRKEETIMLNINTFKKLCLKANTENADKIHDYYIKMEMIYNELMKEELDEQKTKMEEQQKRLEFYELKPATYGFLSRRSGYVYMFQERSKPGHYKIGMTYNVDKRLRNLNTGSSEKTIKIYNEIESYDSELLEMIVHKILKPFNLIGRKEWFFFNDNEARYALYVLYTVHDFLSNYNHESETEFLQFFNNDKLQYLKQTLNNKLNQTDKEDINKKEQIQEIIKDIETNINSTQSKQPVSVKTKEIPKTRDNQDIKETNIYKLTGQQLYNKTGNYKGVFLCKDKNTWRAALKLHYKEIFLGYFESELDGAKAYNDYAMFINNKDNTNYLLNDIPNYIPNPRDIPEENKEEINDKKTSTYNGVSYDSKRKYYVASIKYKSKSYGLGNNENELECAKLYNQQALYFNNKFNTNYVLNDIPNYTTVPKNIYQEIQEKTINKKTSKYRCVTFCKRNNKFRSVLVYNKKQIHIGFFEDELDAAIAYNKKANELNTTTNSKYKLNEIN